MFIYPACDLQIEEGLDLLRAILWHQFYENQALREKIFHLEKGKENGKRKMDPRRDQKTGRFKKVSSCKKGRENSRVQA
jgi:hypothetical protein